MLTRSQPTTVPRDLQRPQDDEVDLFGLTHQGKVRQDNQDHFLVCTIHPQVVIHATSLGRTDELPLRGTRLATALLVADGVGGSAGGSDAARLASEAVTRYVSSSLRSYHAAGASSDEELLASLRDAALQAHDAVRAEAATRGDSKPMATTLTFALVVWPWLYVTQVGDSRCYYWDGAELRLMTRDQTVAQMLVDQGAMPRERLKTSPLHHVLASAIGGDEATPVVTRVAMRRPAGVMLCSDGLTKHVKDEEIAARFKATDTSEQLCRSLLNMAMERGGSDNITIVAGRAPIRDRAS